MRSITVLKYIVSILITVCLISCSKNNREKEPGPTKDVEVEFNHNDINEQLENQKLQELIADKKVRYVYLTTTQHWAAWDSKNIEVLRPFLQKRIEMSPKMRGRGDFDFKLGEASKVPEDSLWFIKQGWTINKAYQKP